MEASMHAPARLTAFVAQKLSKPSWDHDLAHVHTAANSNSGPATAARLADVDDCSVQRSRLLGSQ